MKTLEKYIENYKVSMEFSFKEWSEIYHALSFRQGTEQKKVELQKILNQISKKLIG